MNYYFIVILSHIYCILDSLEGVHTQIIHKVYEVSLRASSVIRRGIIVVSFAVVVGHFILLPHYRGEDVVVEEAFHSPHATSGVAKFSL